jgi:hypothetical protein
MNENVKSVLNTILEKFKDGSVPEAVAYATFPALDVPSSSWSFFNRTIMFLCGGTADARGFRQGKFVLLLMQHAVTFEALPDLSVPGGVMTIGPRPKIKGKSKLRKWSCGCQIVRVGKAVFSATCNLCGNEFRQTE